MSRCLALGCLALSMSLVGSYVALSKPLVAAFPVFLLAWLRFGIGGAAMLHWLRKPTGEVPLTRQTHRLLFLESFLGNFLFSICMLFGMKLSGAVAAGVIMASIPAVCALMSWVFLREHVTWRTWASVAFAVLGIALVSLSKIEQTNAVDVRQNANFVTFLGFSDLPALWLGNALLFAAVLCEAAYAVIGKKLTASMGPKRITALINAWGFALMAPLGLWAAWTFEFAQVAASSWVLLLFYSLAASVWSVWLWMTGLKTVPAAQAGVFTVMLPICAALVGVLILGEAFSLVQAAAYALALVGVVLATTQKASQ